MDNVLTALDVRAFLNNNPLFESLEEKDKDVILAQAWNNVFEFINPSTVLNNDGVQPLYDHSVKISPQSTYTTAQIRQILLGHVQIRSTRAFNVLIAIVSQKIARLKGGYYFDTYREDKFVISKAIGTFSSVVEAEKKILWIRERFLELGLSLEYDKDQLLMHKFIPNQQLVLEFEVYENGIKKFLPKSSLIFEYFITEYDYAVDDKYPQQSLSVEYSLYSDVGVVRDLPATPVIVSYRYSNNANVVKWSGSANTIWWRLEREVGNSGNWDVIAVFPSTERSYLDKDVLIGNNYSYKLTAINEGGESSEVEAPIEKI